MPEVTNGFSGSFGMAFLLQVSPARSSAISAALPVTPFGPQIDQHHMAVGPARDDPQPTGHQRIGQHAGVGDDLPRIVAKFGAQCLAEGHGFGGDDMHQRAALISGKHGRIQLFRQRFVIGQDDPLRGPRRVLCVVEVTTCACGMGSGYSPAAIRPA